MLLNNYKQLKYFTLNTNNKTDTTKWNIPTNYNFSQKAKIALVSINNDTDSNLNMVFCPTIKNNYFSSLNTAPLIYAGIGYNNQNIINEKQYFEINGAFLNEIELKTFSSPPLNELIYPELEGIPPILWYKFDNSGNVGLDTMGKANLVLNGTAALTYDNTMSVFGTGSAKGIATQSLAAIYNFSDIINACTISFWIRITTLNANSDIILDNTSVRPYFLMGRNAATNNITLSFFGASSTSSHFVGQYKADNIWKHFTIVAEKSGTATKITSYLNGVLNATTSSGTWGTSGFTNFIISNTGASSSMIGNLDDLRFYNKVLNQDQINSLYIITRTNYPVVKNESYKSLTLTEPIIGMDLNPLIWYKFDNSANVGLDSMGLANLVNDGINTSMVYDGTIAKRGTGSLKSTINSTLTNNYNFADIVDACTIAFWLQITSITNWDVIFRDKDGLGILYMSEDVATNNIDVALFGSGYQDRVHFSGAFVGNSVWKHYVLVAEKIGTQVKISSYLNGVFNATATTGTWSTAGITGLTLSNGSSGFTGFLDDFRIYNRVLSQTQINDLYQGNTFYNFPSASTRYNTNPTNTTYQFEVVDDEQKIISHY